MPPGGGMPQPASMDLEGLAKRIMQANPGIEQNPRILLAAMERAVPLLNAQSRQQLAELKQQFTQQNLDLRERQVGENERRNRATEGQRDRREERLSETDRRKAEQWKQNQERLKDNARNRFEDAHARLDLATQKAKTYNEKVKTAQDIDLAKQELATTHRAIIEQIQANNVMNAEEKKRLVEEAVKNRNESLMKLEGLRMRLRPDAAVGDPDAPKRVPTESFKRPGSIVDAQGASSAPPAKDTGRAPSGDPLQGVPVPVALKGDPDGTTYQKDGKTYVKRGDKLVPQ